MNAIPQIRVMWNSSRSEWVVNGYNGPSMPGGRQFYATKQEAIDAARGVAKDTNAALMVETKGGVGDMRADYREQNTGKSSGGSSILDDMLGL